jgi:hypothetical protein
MLGLPETILDLVVFVGLITLLVAVITRLGLLAAVVAMTFATWAHVPLTTDTSSWFFASSAVTMMVFAAVAIYGFVVSLGGRVAFTERVLDS